MKREPAQRAGQELLEKLEVLKYMPLQKVGEKGSRYHMQDVDGEKHWVYRKLVTNSMRCATVKVASANVRSGPGTNHETLFSSPLEKYCCLKIIETRGDWVRVEDELSNKGWVCKLLLWIQ